MRNGHWVLILLMLSGSIAPAGLAQSEADIEAARIEGEASRIFNTVMSPFCPGLLLVNCPSSNAEALRDEMRRKLANGITADAIMDEFFATYGDAYRAVPEAKGFGLTAWFAPLAFLVAGGLWLAIWLARNAHRRPDAAGSEEEVDLDPALQRRLEEELTHV